MEGMRTSSNFVTSLLRFHALRSKTNTVRSGKFEAVSVIVLRWLVHCVVLKMSEAAEASFVVEPYQFEPILTESDRESCDDDSTNSENGGYDMNEDRIGQLDW